MSEILMNAADNGIIAAKKNHNQFHSGNCMALTTVQAYLFLAK